MPPLFSPAEAAPRLKALAEAWQGNTANEKAVFQMWWIAFCEALGVPGPATPPTDDDRFELAILTVERDGRESTNYIDYWKAGHAAVEAKASEAGRSNEQLLIKAFGQVRNYAANIGALPPYLMVVDVPKTAIVWDKWSGNFGGFAAGKRMALATLHERLDDIALLQDILTRPDVRDPRGRAQAVTKEIAAGLATLAAALERRGFDQERVARFLMRCVFCCFAEDVSLLPRDLFKRTLETARRSGDATRVAAVLTGLWTTMDQGGMFGAEMLHRFNGHFFKSVEALPLDPEDVDLLIQATSFDWSHVEPSIFGTLLVRALDPVERHRLGAEYTPREYIERLVEPTVVEPIRERWTAVQAAVLQFEDEAVKAKKPAGQKAAREKAKKELRDFHAWLRGLQFLDPACGSGNFLYVTMAAVKRIELEVISATERVGGKEQKEAILDEVHPRQFHGIEIKPWAREIAELTLWIGYHQFWREAHGGRTPPDPILEDTGTIECRDAVLAYDAIVHRPEMDRPDPTPRIVSPVTGELIPDPNAKLKYMEYVNPRPAEWPKADFIVGNPPYLGNSRQRDALGDGYVDAIRAAYYAIPDSADLVMYWWWRAAEAVRVDAQRAGLITTNSITQPLNRAVIESELNSGSRVIWAVADHPWIDDMQGAAVRVALTVISRESLPPRLAEVDDRGGAIHERTVDQLNADLSSHADVTQASSRDLLGSRGLSSDGVKLHGGGFLLTRAEATEMLQEDSRLEAVIKPYSNGRDIASRSRGNYVIDFGLRTEAEASAFPRALQRVIDRVKPERVANTDRSTRERWWLFGRNREQLRDAISSLERYVITVDTARHRYFLFVPTNLVVDDKIVCIAVDGSELLGVLSSAIHVAWANAAGTRLGKGNDPVYLKTRCFDPFPFPGPAPELRTRIGALAERLDAHRKDAIARDERVTMTGMYNVVEKLRSGEQLTPKERAIHEIAACGVLRDLHDELDALVAEAYGWPWPMEKEEILERLVKLHDERVEEEKRGQIRWLRPEYQVPRFAPAGTPATLGIPDAPAAAAEQAAALRQWPATAVEQLAAIGALVGQEPRSAGEIGAAFAKAKPELVARHLETLALMGEIAVDGEGRYSGVRKTA
jgi:hypothetical protein